MIADGGCTCPGDVAKAFGGGADFVMLGRPFMFALGAEGARGLNSLIRTLGEDVSLTLAQTGLANINDVSHSMLVDCPPELIQASLTSIQNATHQN